VNETGKKFRTELPVLPASRQASTMYLVRLRAHLSRGKIALGEVYDAVSDVLPLPNRRDRGQR
jgi:hypothetical protein